MSVATILAVLQLFKTVSPVIVSLIDFFKTRDPNENWTQEMIDAKVAAFLDAEDELDAEFAVEPDED